MPCVPVEAGLYGVSVRGCGLGFGFQGMFTQKVGVEWRDKASPALGPGLSSTSAAEDGDAGSASDKARGPQSATSQTLSDTGDDLVCLTYKSHRLEGSGRLPLAGDMCGFGARYNYMYYTAVIPTLPTGMENEAKRRHGHIL